LCPGHSRALLNSGSYRPQERALLPDRAGWVQGVDRQKTRRSGNRWPNSTRRHFKIVPPPMDAARGPLSARDRSRAPRKWEVTTTSPARPRSRHRGNLVFVPDSEGACPPTLRHRYELFRAITAWGREGAGSSLHGRWQAVRPAVPALGTWFRSLSRSMASPSRHAEEYVRWLSSRSDNDDGVAAGSASPCRPCGTDAECECRL